jgi:15-cis-phytoene synthase
MHDAFAYCADLVRSNDRDRYLATLFAPAEHRDALYALYAFNAEIARVRDVAREPLPGEIRLQWWADVLNGERDGEASANPVAAALLDTIQRHKLGTALLAALIDAHRFDLYDEPMATISDLKSYAQQTHSGLMTLAARILGVEEAAVTDPSGIALALVRLLRAFPQHAASHQLFVPAELLARHKVASEDVFAGRVSPELLQAVDELRRLAVLHLAEAAKLMPAAPPAIVPALLPLAVARLDLDRMDRTQYDPFSPPEISPLRRQWVIWRAARSTKRIAG